MLLGEQAQAHLDEKAWGDDKGGVFCHNEQQFNQFNKEYDKGGVFCQGLSLPLIRSAQPP